MIFPHHMDDLASSGITEETALENGIHSEADNAKVASILGWGKTAKRLGSCLAFPVYTLEGQLVYTRFKPDNPRTRSNGKPIKYETPKEATNRIYIPSGVRGLANESTELLITEGEKKALSATQHGFPCIGLFGVQNWKSRNQSELLPCFRRFRLKNRKVVIAFDSDVETNPNIQSAEQWLAFCLEKEGADVRVLRLPDAIDGAKQGIDDLLMAKGPKELRRFIDAAENADAPPSELFKEQLSKVPPEVVADEYLAANRIGGTLQLRYWNEAFYRWHRGKYHELREADVKADLVRRLRASYTNIGCANVANVMLNVASSCSVLSTAYPPRWLDGGDEIGRTWKPREMFCMKSHILHLPSLVAGNGGVVDATPKFFSVVAADYDFDPDATRPECWLNFLDDLWGGDHESIELLQQWFGYMLVPDTSQQKILLMVGPKRCGKGTIARVLASVVGPDNVCSPTLQSISTNFGLSPLLGKTVAIVGDARLSGRTDIAATAERLLSISGEDAQTIDRKHKEPITTTLQTRFMILTNELPQIRDASGALPGRMLVLKLTESFIGKEDTGLLRRLLAERQSILKWAIEGWRKLQSQGRFIEPEASRDETEHLRDLASPITQFVDECCGFSDSSAIGVDSLYAAFREWSEGAGIHYTPERSVFSRNLTAAHPELKRVRRTEHGRKTTQIKGVHLVS